MKKQLKLLNFDGQNLFIGIDCHLKSWKVTIYSDEFELKTFSQEPNSAKLAEHLHMNYPGAQFSCVYEAGFSGYWIQRELSSYGINCIIVHPADIPTMDREKKLKSDVIDSRKLCRSLRSREIEGIYIPHVELQEARSLVRARVKLVSDLTRVKNRIKFFLMFYGITISTKGNSWGKNYLAKLQQVELSTEAGQKSLEFYLQELHFLIEKEKWLRKQIEQLSLSDQYKEDVRLLRTIPSVGLITAMTVITEIGDINRFKSLDKLSCYFGLIPTSHSSGEKERIGRNTSRGNKYLKHLLIESAWIIIRKDPGLLLYYKKQIAVMESNKAIIKVARKLLNRIRLILTQKIEYQCGRP
ncbi:IS110 family transposase [Bacteroidota bacterium]